MTDLDRRTLFKAGAAGTGGLLLASVGVAGSPALAAPRVATVLTRKLEVPWGLTFLPNGDALVGERISGDVYRVSRHGGRTRAGHVSGVRDDAGEGGLLGLACSPDFARDRLVYAYLSAASENRIVAMRYVGGRLRRQQRVLGDIPTASTHNGGRLAFGPEGHLFATTGDTRQSNLAQDTGSLAGKILRMTPDGGAPADNPFGNLVWSFGHRNVEGISFDRRGRLWATEFGENTTDELNRIVRGDNYGWPRVEGGDGPGGFHDPFATWSPTSRCSPSGVAVTRGKAWVGALAGRALLCVNLTGPHRGRKHRFFENRFGRIRTVELSPDGALWLTTSNRDGRGSPVGNDDRVIRIRF